MNPFFPPLITVFLGVFHLLGGGALGQGVRAALRESDQSVNLILWGGLMGGLPLVFDWYFLIAQGHIIYGLIGPLLFLISASAAAFLRLRIDGPAVLSAVVGSAALFIGLLVIPLMLGRAQEFELGITDYLFGAVFVLMFVLIGGAFAWNGFSAMLRGISLDQAHAERAQKIGRSRKRKSVDVTIKKYWE